MVVLVVVIDTGHDGLQCDAAACRDASSRPCCRVQNTAERHSSRDFRSFRIVFSSSEDWKKQISRQESTAWQRRIRQALEARAARVGIELR